MLRFMSAQSAQDLYAWIDEFPGAVTVCDGEGIVLAMNDASAKTFEKDGGRALIGKSLVDCHPEPARGKLLALLRERRANAYTIEKNGVRKLIYQVPWTRDGQFAGLVEIAFQLPSELPHFVRQ
jgi:transcriptional regulator with PAS, ATPase and Fis domain